MRMILLASTLFAACSPILGSERVRVPAEIAGYNTDDPRLEVAAVNGTVRVAIVSYGNGCYSKGETEVRVSGRTVDVHPYDYRSDQGACPDILLSFVHEATIPFATPGAVTVRVHGRQRGQGTPLASMGGAITIERVVQIP